MSLKDKMKEKLKNNPRNFTYSEARTLLSQLGYVEESKGRTSGSRVLFRRLSDNKKILLHKPHPKDVMKITSVKCLYEQLVEYGDFDK